MIVFQSAYISACVLECAGPPALWQGQIFENGTRLLHSKTRAWKKKASQPFCHSVQTSVPRHAWPVTLLATFHVVAKIRVYRFVAPKLCEGGCPSVVKKLLNCETNPIFNASLYQ
jgi:hypothetical protein